MPLTCNILKCSLPVITIYDTLHLNHMIAREEIFTRYPRPLSEQYLTVPLRHANTEATTRFKRVGRKTITIADGCTIFPVNEVRLR